MLTVRVKEFLLRVRRKNTPDHHVGRRYGDFAKLHKRLRTELPGKVLPPLPHKNKSSTTAPTLLGGSGGDNSETSSISSVSTQMPNSPAPNGSTNQAEGGVQRLLSVKGWSCSCVSEVSYLPCCVDNRSRDRLSPRSSVDGRSASPAPPSPKFPLEVRSPA